MKIIQINKLIYLITFQIAFVSCSEGTDPAIFNTDLDIIENPQ